MEGVETPQNKSETSAPLKSRTAKAAEDVGAKRKRVSSPIDSGDGMRQAAMEVTVENNIEKAMKVLKRKLIKEGLFRELKTRRYHEKPSERKKRKGKESIKKLRKEEARQKKNPYF